MSFSKEPKLAADTAEQRQPKCTRCRHHGIIVPRKGHLKRCPFLKCECWKCYLVTQRTRITALQKAPNNPQNEKKRAGASTADSAVKPAAEETCSTSAPDESALPSATSGVTCRPSDGAPEQAATFAPGEESVTGSNSREVPLAASEEGPHNFTPINTSYFGEFGQTAPLPFIHFPFRMSGHYPGSYAPRPNLLLNPPPLPPMPAGLYDNSGLWGGPLMFNMFPTSSHMLDFTHHHQDLLLIGPSSPYNHLPPPETLQEEPMSRQHPQPPLD